MCHFPDWHKRALEDLIRPIERPYECDSRGSGTLDEHKAPKSCIVVSVEKFALKMINNDTLEMLMSREQLMCDIDGIVEEFACNNIISEDVMKSLTRVLCDSVCRNFPTM